MKRLWLLAAILAGAWVSAAAQSPTASPASTAAAPAAAAPATGAAAPADPAAAARTRATTVCAACHGADGNSAIRTNPSLAGMPAEYISEQLAHFKAGIRVNPIMQSMAAPLSPEDMKQLGIYFSQQKPRGQGATDASIVQLGQKLYRGGDASSGLPACAACHAPNGAGIPKRYPRLAGQHSEYTVAQLKAFKAGERGNDKEGKDVNGRIMGTIAAKLNDQQMQALAQYTQGLR